MTKPTTDHWVNITDVIAVLVEDGMLKGSEFVSHIKPGHGSCCTCQKCGYGYDDCVCEHNELLGKLMGLATAWGHGGNDGEERIANQKRGH